MKTVCVLAFLLITSPLLYAQHPVKSDTIVPGKGHRDKQRRGHYD